MVLYISLSIIIILVDQITKYFFIGSNFSIIGDFLWFFGTYNDGASFGMMSGGRMIFIIITIPLIIFIGIVIFSKKVDVKKSLKICLTLIMSGAIGNLLDRIFIGRVRDFIYLKSINFAIFNFADSVITIGTILFILFYVINISKANDKNTSVKDGK